MRLLLLLAVLHTHIAHQIHRTYFIYGIEQHVGNSYVIQCATIFSSISYCASNFDTHIHLSIFLVSYTWAHATFQYWITITQEHYYPFSIEEIILFSKFYTFVHVQNNSSNFFGNNILRKIIILI